MRTTFVSTASLLGTPRSATMRMQSQLAQLNQEVVTGRMADVGLNLGAKTGRSITLHVDTQALAALIGSNSTLSTRLTQTQSALDTLRTSADDFLQQLVSARSSAAGTQTLATLAQTALTGFIGDMNASDGSNTYFGGINSSQAPINDYDSGPGAALAAAFQAQFGITPDDPAAADISAADMNDFLDNAFADLFADPAWGADWSNASDTATTARISQTETVTTSVSANEPAMRKLAMVYSMIAGLGVDNLGEDTRNAVLDKAIQIAGQAIAGVNDIQTRLGGVQNRVTAASTKLSTQKDIVETNIDTLEGVDAAEAKVKIDSLSTQIEMSYSLTAKLLQMSILNYA